MSTSVDSETSEESESEMRSLDAATLIEMFGLVETIHATFLSKDLPTVLRVYNPGSTMPRVGQFYGLMLRLKAAFADRGIVIDTDPSSFDAADSMTRKNRHALASYCAEFIYGYVGRLKKNIGSVEIPADLALDLDVFYSHCESLRNLLIAVGYTGWTSTKR